MYRHARPRLRSTILSLVYQAVFCKYKCYFSEAFYIVSNYCGSFHYAKKLFKSIGQFLLCVW